MIAKQVEGIGPKKSLAVAAAFPQYCKLRAVNLRALLGVTRLTSSGKLAKALTRPQGKAFLRILRGIPSSYDARAAAAYLIATDFAKDQLGAVQALTLDQLMPNPFVLQSLGLRSPKDLVTFLVYQAITRSAVTAWGAAVERIVLCSGCERPTRVATRRGTNFDAQKATASQIVMIQIKSGPDTMNVGMVDTLNKAMSSLAPGETGLLGMTFGRRGQISAKILSTLSDPVRQTKIGKEFWDFVSDETDFHVKLMRAIDAAATNALGRGQFLRAVKAKIDQLSDAWAARYQGIKPEDALQTLF